LTGTPTPGVFGERVRIVLKTKGERSKVVQRVWKVLKTNAPWGFSKEAWKMMKLKDKDAKTNRPILG
jgi:hypothetical protein